ncbi:MAG: hypothetical protein RIB03_04760 [Henriciella sp.]|uniref:hypothetical protein n=1 Tax=Henriciella sp. TaxID=1968823 RepID=UPI0032EFC8DD
MYTPRLPSNPSPEPPTRYGWKQLWVWFAQGFVAPFGLFLLSWAAVAAWYVMAEGRSLDEAFEAGGWWAMLLFFLSGGSIIIPVFLNDGLTKATGMRILGVIGAMVVMWNVFSRMFGLG